MFRLGRHENTELNASKFAETVYRILQSITDSAGTYTRLGQHIPRFTEKCRGFEQADNTRFDVSIRMHIPRALILIVDVRNGRGVGHVSGIHSPNLMDSTMVVRVADWIVAELLRLYHGCSIDKAQALVDTIVQIDLPMVADLGDVRRVLDTTLSYPEQTLILLYCEASNRVRARDLFEWTEHSNWSIYRSSVLQRLHHRREIEYRNEQCLILPPGILRIEPVALHRSSLPSQQ